MAAAEIDGAEGQVEMDPISPRFWACERGVNAMPVKIANQSDNEVLKGEAWAFML